MLGCNLTEHLGVIDLGDTEVEVAISFEDSRLRLTSAGSEIGYWERPKYQLSRADRATFIISAEGDDLSFKPLHPEEFAVAAMNGTAQETKVVSHRKKRGRHDGTDSAETVPPARPITLV
ncbi:MAG: hypothetical protein WDZ96_05885, partial [Acidimicrobiia bacterium]